MAVGLDKQLESKQHSSLAIAFCSFSQLCGYGMGCGTFEKETTANF